MLKEYINSSFEEAIRDFLIGNYGNSAQQWIDNIDGTVQYLSKKWKINIRKNCDLKSKFGFLMLGTTQGIEVVLKLIPPCCPRLEQEINCYSILPYHNMAELLRYDMEKGAFLLKKICCKPIENITMIADLFESMYKERVVATTEQLTIYKKAFCDSLSNAYCKIIESNDKQLMHYLPLIQKAKDVYSKQQNEVSYLLHGDAHINNILYDGEELILIDPIGYIGPFEIEYARFIGTFIRENDLYDMPLKNVIEKISRNNCSIDNIAAAIGYDVTMRACNTFCEGNTYEEIIDALKWAEKIWNLVDQITKIK